MTTHSFGALLSAYTGTLLCKFSDMHACIETMAGGPVWTHQLPTVTTQLRPRMLAEWPDLGDWDVSGVDRDTFAAWHAERAHILDEQREVPCLSDAPSPSPFDYMPEGKDVIAVVTQ